MNTVYQESVSSAGSWLSSQHLSETGSVPNVPQTWWDDSAIFFNCPRWPRWPRHMPRRLLLGKMDCIVGVSWVVTKTHDLHCTQPSHSNPKCCLCDHQCCTSAKPELWCLCDLGLFLHHLYRTLRSSRHSSSLSVSIHLWTQTCLCHPWPFPSLPFFSSVASLFLQSTRLRFEIQQWQQ